MNISDKIDIMYRFTKQYRENIDMPVAIREAKCLKVQFPSILCSIQPGDLFAGRLEYLPIGFSPQAGYGMGYYCIKEQIAEMLDSPEISDQDREKLIWLNEFWKDKTTNYKIREACPEKVKEALPSDDYAFENGIAFPLYRLGGTQMNFEKLLKLGIPGMLDEIESYERKAIHQGKNGVLYQGMKMALDILIDSCLYYKRQAEEMAMLTDDEEWKRELTKIAETLYAITRRKPESFREAIQLMFLYAILSGTYNYGRMDTYLADYYVHDVDHHIVTEAEALKLLESLWILIDEQRKIHDCRVIIGGMGRKNEQNQDRFALLAMEATRRVRRVTPQLTLRFYKGMNPELMDKALEVIGEGTTYPMLYNDDVNVPAVMKAFHIEYEEALDYVPFGCGEYTIFHKSLGTPSGIINVLKALEVTMFNGTDPLTGKKMGLALGEFRLFKTFDEFYNAYCKQLEYHIEALAIQEKVEYDVAGQDAAFLFFSMLYDDCMERGLALLSGGVRYLGGTLESYGNINASDSLTAIKSLIYDKKLISPDRMLEALRADFVGYEKEREFMLNEPKYGNDDDIADSMAQKLHNFICNTTRNQAEKVGLHNYMIVLINNSGNTGQGKKTGASPDGRKNRATMANANNPYNGMDKNGITAMLNSLVKLDCTIHAGAVQNMKFSKEMFGKQKEKLRALLDTYFMNGGTQAMITVLDRKDLENAMKEPEKYKHLIVRVGGFSARFVELSREIQLDIISRTLY